MLMMSLGRVLFLQELKKILMITLNWGLDEQIDFRVVFVDVA